ncbi:MAG: pyruvate kinase [Acholeplasmatales bacterium]|nr:pyruvate kinase [Acholeplasmatales bacterium]
MRELKKTKIICTIGPASENKTTLAAMVASGMNIARLNFSHGSYEEHLKKIELIRSLEAKLDRPIGIMLDTKGPEIRIHTFVNGSATIHKGDIFKIYSQEIEGSALAFSVNFPAFFDNIKINQLVKIDDGKFVAIVLSKDNNDRSIILRAQNNHQLSNRKGVNIIGGRLKMPFLSQRDIEDIKFGVANGIDFIASSFVRRKEDVLDLRNLLKEIHHEEILVVSKIESVESLKNIDAIIEASDAIMVARGDLGVEVNPEKVPILQIEIIEKCRRLGKPVIIATQMLESMQHSIRPTRAEVNDVALAVFQGADCVMLSGESASGEYPIESTKMQYSILREVERHLDYKSHATTAFYQSKTDYKDSLANAATVAAINSKCRLIIVFDEDGALSIRLSKSRPIVPIICLTSNIKVARRLSLFWGVFPRVIDLDDINMSNQNLETTDTKFLFVKQVTNYYKVTGKASVILIREKMKEGFNLREESIRILDIN